MQDIDSQIQEPEANFGNDICNIIHFPNIILCNGDHAYHGLCLQDATLGYSWADSLLRRRQGTVSVVSLP